MSNIEKLRAVKMAINALICYDGDAVQNRAAAIEYLIGEKQMYEMLIRNETKKDGEQQ